MVSATDNANEENDKEQPLENREFQEETGDPQKANNDDQEPDGESQDKNNPTEMEDDHINNNAFDDENEQLIQYSEDVLPLIVVNKLHLAISTITEMANKKINTEILEEYEKRVCIETK